MQFQKVGNIFKIAYVSGPTHNFLGLEFCDQDGEEVVIESLIINPKEPVILQPYSVRSAVMEGLAQANDELATQFYIRRIQYVVSDSPPVEIYANLARQIIARRQSFPQDYNGTTE